MAASRTKTTRPSLNGIPGLMTLGIGRGEDYEPKGGFDFGKSIDGTYIAFDKPEHTASASGGRTDEELHELIASKRLGETRMMSTVGSGAGGPEEDLFGKKLTFKCYFQEAVTESRIEASRYRHLLLTFFLVDGSVELVEPEVRNSGMPPNEIQPFGRFLKRITHPAVTVETLRIGETIDVFGHVFKLYDCDDYTRSYYEALGDPQEGPFEPPMDAHGTAVLATTAKYDSGYGMRMNSLKRYQESRLGMLIAKSDVKAKFLKYGSSRLCFYAIWEDKATWGDTHRYSVTYFLADGEVQIIEQHDKGGAQVLFPILLKRQRLGRKVMIYDDRKSSCEDGDGSEDYYNEDDLRVGSTLDVYGREFLIYDCDGVTQKWYLENKGIDQKAGKVEIKKEAAAVVAPTPPPPTGFGSEEDSLQSWKHLIPKPIRKDVSTWRDTTNTTLKFMAQLVTRTEEDKSRKFRITWYLDDKTVAIYEPPQRNSGIVGGAFAARSRFRNPATKAYYKVSDLFVGAVVSFNAHDFEIVSADEFSLKHMEKNSDSWPMSSVKFVLTNLKIKIRDGSKSLRKMFRKFDLDHSMTISLEEFMGMLNYYGMGLCGQEAITLFRAFDTDGSGLINYDEFISAFADKEGATGIAAMDMSLNVDYKDMTEEEVALYAAMCSDATDAEKMEAYTNALLVRISVAIRNSKAATVLYQKFRQFDENKDNKVDRMEFRMAMGGGAGHGIFHLMAKDVEILEQAFFSKGQESLNYEDFISVVTEFADKQGVRYA